MHTAGQHFEGVGRSRGRGQQEGGSQQEAPPRAAASSTPSAPVKRIRISLRQRRLLSYVSSASRVPLPRASTSSLVIMPLA